MDGRLIGKMLQRAEFYDLQGKLEKVGILIPGISRESERAIDFLNSCELNDNLDMRMKWLVQAEDLIKNVFNKVLVKINPYANALIGWDDKRYETYRKFKFRMGSFIKSIDGRRQNIIDKISLKKSEESEKSNRMNIDSFAVFLTSILRELILEILKESYRRFISVEKPSFREEDGEKVVYWDMSAVAPEGDEQIFWYYVYFYIAELSETNMALFTADDFKFRPAEIRDLGKVTGGVLGSDIGSSIGQLKEQRGEEMVVKEKEDVGGESSEEPKIEESDEFVERGCKEDEKN